MKLDLDNLNPGVFFPFDEDGDDKSGVTIRLANGETLDEINKKCTKKKEVFRRGVRNEVITDNEELRSQMLWEYVIIDWNGLIDDKTGDEIPCTEENKTKIMRGSVMFSSFIGECVEKLTADTESYQEDLEKNLQV